VNLIFEEVEYNGMAGETLIRYRPWNGTAKRLIDWSEKAYIFMEDLRFLQQQGCLISIRRKKKKKKGILERLVPTSRNDGSEILEPEFECDNETCSVSPSPSASCSASMPAESDFDLITL
jgi:hypothetical protein